MKKEKLLISYLFLAAVFFAVAPVANAAYSYGHNDNWGGHYTPPPAPRHDYDNHYQYHPIQTPIYTYPTQTYSYPVYYPVTQPVYYPVSQPVYYQQPTTYYQPNTYYQQPTTYYQPAQTYAYNYQYTAPQYTVPGQNNAGLTVSCSAETSTATVNQPVSWTAQVSGGIAPYTYSWSGSDGLSGSQNSIVKYYTQSGQENALVTVTSANGLTGTQACSNVVNVQNPAAAYVPPVQNPIPQTSEANVNLNAAAVGLSAAVFGWIVAIIILILLGSIIYIVVSRRG